MSEFEVFEQNLLFEILRGQKFIDWSFKRKKLRIFFQKIWQFQIYQILKPRNLLISPTLLPAKFEINQFLRDIFKFDDFVRLKCEIFTFLGVKLEIIRFFRSIPYFSIFGCVKLEIIRLRLFLSFSNFLRATFEILIS